MAGLNIESIRNLNKINVYAVKNKIYDTNGKVKEQPSSRIFSAYLTEPLGHFDGGAEVSSITQQIGETLKGLGIVKEIAGSAVGKFLSNVGSKSYGNLLGTGFDWSNAAGINYNFNYRFTGNTSTFSHVFNCELVVKDDFIDDVIYPLWNILSYVMPDESQELENTTQYEMFAGIATEYFGKAKDKVNSVNAENPFIDQDWLEKAWEYIKTLGGEIGDMAGGCSIIMKPKQLQGGMSHTRITIGDFIEIDDVIIESVGFDIPYLLYDGGLFDKVKVSLKVTGNRKMTLKTYDWIKQLVMSTFSYERLEPIQPKTIPLNQQFGSVKKSNNSNTSLTGVDTITNDTSNLA